MHCCAVQYIHVKLLDFDIQNAKNAQNAQNSQNVQNAKNAQNQVHTFYAYMNSILKQGQLQL